MITRMTFKWTFGYHVMFPLLRDTLQNPRQSVSSWVMHMLTIPFFSLPVFVLLSHWSFPASPWHSHLCLAIRWWMPSHQDSPMNISPSSEEQIPLSSCLVPCQAFRWTCKLSLWSPSYRWCLSNPKVHRTVGTDYDTLMARGTKKTC
jgi:hypothetical protein